jgi:hypothetical protein
MKFLGLIFSTLLFLSVTLAQNVNPNNPMNGFISNGGSYGGRWNSYSANIANVEASYAKAYSMAIYYWSLIGLYIGLALLGVVLTWVYWQLLCSSNISPNQIFTIVTSTILTFVLLLLLVFLLTSWSMGLAIPGKSILMR